jgi:hypothetical protein
VKSIEQLVDELIDEAQKNNEYDNRENLKRARQAVLDEFKKLKRGRDG